MHFAFSTTCFLLLVIEDELINFYICTV